MRRFKRILSMFLAILMVTSILPMTVIAESIQNTHTVQFNLNYNGAHKIPSQKVADGECAVEPENATRTGWILKGWYNKKNGGEKFDFSKPIHENVTLYAQWDEDIEYWGPIWNQNILDVIEDGKDEDTNECRVSFVLVVDSIVDNYYSFQDVYLSKGEKVTKPADPISKYAEFIGWYTDFSYTTEFNFDTIITTDTYIFAKWKFDFTDIDGDGLYDDMEQYLGTDMNAIDSDKDGINDYDEVMVLGSNPLRTDTDEDGVEDADEDSDEDKLTNKEELYFGTSMIISDTDMDGLSDYDEIYVCNRSALLEHKL